MEEKKDITKAMERVENRYLLVNVVVERVKSMKKRLATTDDEVDGTLINRALKEVAEGKIKIKDKIEESMDASSGGGGGKTPWVA